MSYSYPDICRHFLAGDEPKKGWFPAVRGGFHGGGARTHDLYSDQGTRRLSYKNDGGPVTALYPRPASTLLSYERFVVAARFINKQEEVVILINADEGPSNTTKTHQRELRHAVKRAGLRAAYLPFSALRSAGIHSPSQDVEIIATTEDRTVERPVQVLDKITMKMKTVMREEHFLGETLFKSGGRYYVSGLDRNDSPRRRHFYLVRLYDMVRGPKTVDEALDMLRPNQVPQGALRQGEWYFVPGPTTYVPVRGSVVNSHPAGTTGDGRMTGVGVPILSASAAEMKKSLEYGSYAFVGRHDRHVATRMVFQNDDVLVSGMVRDSSHDALKLGDGKTWFRVYKNLADGSWNASGDVD